MKKNLLLSTVLTLFLLVPASITWAQTVSSQKGLTIAIFKLPNGYIKVYLPSDIRPGETISGTVVSEPGGKNEKEKAKNLAQLKRYAIGITGNTVVLENTVKPFKFSLPTGKPSGLKVALTNGEGIKTSAVRVPSIPENEQPITNSDCNIPSHALTGSPFRITGPFDGDASNTKCMLENKPMDILAESPRQCIVSYPSTAGGMHTVTNQESGKPACINKVSGVDMNISAGKLDLLKGEKTYIDVKVTGLANLQDTAHLTLINVSTDVITMADGNTVAVSIPPSGSTRDTYTQRFNAQSIKTGTFTVNVALVLPENVSTAPPANTTPSTTASTTPPNTNTPTTTPNTTTPATTPVPTVHVTTVPATTTAVSKSANPRLRFEIDGNDVSVVSDGEYAATKPHEPVQIYAFGNTIRIFFNGLYIDDFEVTNPGSQSVQDILTEYSDPSYAAPDISCDSMTRICKKNAAFNVFWGDVYSVFEGKMESKHVQGETVETASQNSLLITRGWEIDCCTGEFQLKLFLQTMQGTGGKGSHNVSFSRLLKTGNPCPIKCPECKKKCDEMNRQMEEARKKMEEIRKKEAGGN